MKAMCILLVFLRHCEHYFGCFLGRVDNLYLTIYVNAFLFISGYLLFWKQLSQPKILEGRKMYGKQGGKQLFLNILYKLIIPSILFSAIEFLPSCYIQGRGIKIGYALFKTIGGGTYWFTSALVVAELILLLLFLTRKRSIWFYASICFVLGAVGLLIVRLSIVQNGVWAWRQGLICMIFLAMGGLYWRYEEKIDRMMRWWIALLLLIVYVIMVIKFEGFNNPLISTLRIQPLGFVTSAIACLLLVWFCKKLPKITPLTFIGQNSLGFYFMSGALPISFSLVARKAGATSSVWVLFAVWIACLCMAYIAVKLINRWMPWLWDLRVINHYSK